MPPHPRDGRALLGHLGWGAHTHRIRPLVRIAQRRSGVVRWRVRHIQQLGPQWGIALPNCTAKATHLRMPGHCLVTLGGGPHTHLKDHIRRCQHRVCDGSNCGMGVKRWCGHHLQHVGPQWGIGGSAPIPQGRQGTAWSPGGGGTDHHNHYTTTFGAADTVFYSSGVVWWCARHPLHPRDPSYIPGRWQGTEWSPSGA